jgi:predicted Zn finger-like uncharacterized protein
MFTCCPECKTTFRLSAGDLRRGKGRVRCGDCGDVFNAVEYLAEDPVDNSPVEGSPVDESQPTESAPFTPELSNEPAATADSEDDEPSWQDEQDDQETYDDNSGIYSIGDPDDEVRETPRISLTAVTVAESATEAVARDAVFTAATDSEAALETEDETEAETGAATDDFDDGSTELIAAEQEAAVTEQVPATMVVEDENGNAVFLLDTDEEFDDTLWERIPGVGSDEPVDSVSDDPIFASPAEPIFGAPDLPEDDEFAAAAEDLPDVQLPDEPAAVTEVEVDVAAESEQDTDTSFRDEFEPIKAIQADTLEFNAPEASWSDIFSATGSNAADLEIVDDPPIASSEDDADDPAPAEPVAVDAYIQDDVFDAQNETPAADTSDSLPQLQTDDAAPVNSVAADAEDVNDELWSGTLTEWEQAASETLAAIAGGPQPAAIEPEQPEASKNTEPAADLEQEAADEYMEPAANFQQDAADEDMGAAADLKQEADNAWDDAADDLWDVDAATENDTVGDEAAEDPSGFSFEEASVDSIAARTMGLKHGEYDVQHIVLEDESTSAMLMEALPPEAEEGQEEPPPWQTGIYENVAVAKKSSTWLWFVGGLVLLIVLAVQLVHYNRDSLATSGAWGDTVRMVYGTLGMRLYPEWSTENYEIRGSEAVAGESGPNVMDIRAQVAAIGSAPTGLPHLRVVLRDRWSNEVAARQFSPAEYAAATLPADGIMQPNDTVAAHVTVADPGSGAQGFELEICMPRRSTGLECAGLINK